jgi:hypothetical protein
MAQYVSGWPVVPPARTYSMLISLHEFLERSARIPDSGLCNRHLDLAIAKARTGIYKNSEVNGRLIPTQSIFTNQ